MSPIPDNLLFEIVTVDPSATVYEARQLLMGKAAGEDLATYHIVVRLPDGRFSVLTAARLNAVYERGGQEVLNQALQDIEGLLVPSLSIQQDAELEEARELLVLSRREILVVLKDGEPHRTFPSRDLGAAGPESLPLFDRTPELAEPGGGLGPAEVPAVAEQRCVHAQIRHDERPRSTFLAGADNVIRTWISLPEPDAGAVADRPIPTADLPPEGVTLDAILQWEDQTDHGVLHLPCYRTARSSECDLRIHVPEDERFVSAKIAFRYRGRAFEVVQVKAFVLPPGAVEEDHHTVEVRVQVAQREAVALTDSNKVDAMVICEGDRTRVDSGDGRGPTCVRVYAGKRCASYNLRGFQAVVDYLNTELFVAEKVLVRQRVREGKIDAVLDTEDEDVRSIFLALARHGAALYKNLGEGFRDPGNRIQLLNDNPREYCPVEFIYDRGYTAADAKICLEGLAALADPDSDPEKCPRCRPADELTVEERDWNTTICPFGFWSLQKIIERRDLVREDAGDAGGQSFPLPNRRHLSPVDSVLFASSNKVKAADQTETWESLQRAVPRADWAASWTEWKSSLARSRHALLLAMPHHGGEGRLDYLEVGDARLPEQDRRVSRGRLSKLYTNPQLHEPGPIVLLLGCRTDAPTDLGYVGLARRFQQLHVSIVVGTLAKVLGHQAAPVAREIVTQLASVDDPDADFGTIMRRVRRRMLARGYLMALCLVALGDAEWRLTPIAGQ